MKKIYLVPAFAAAILLQPVICPAPAYMKLGDIKGEATDAAHLEWSEAYSVSFQTGGSNGSNSDPTFADLVCIKELDKASPKLMEACAKGVFFPEAIFDLTRVLPGGEEEIYLRYKLKDVFVSSYSFHGASSGDVDPIEDFSLNFEEIKVTYGGIRKTYLRYDESGKLVEVVSVGLAAQPGGTPPPPDLSSSAVAEDSPAGEVAEEIQEDAATPEAASE